MEAIHQQSYMSLPLNGVARKSMVHQFMDWCKGQEENRFLWLAIIIASHGSIITPITVLLIGLSGDSMLLWSFAIAAIGMALFSNLAAAPTKITLPLFFTSLVIDAVLIVICIIHLV